MAEPGQCLFVVRRRLKPRQRGTAVIVGDGLAKRSEPEELQTLFIRRGSLVNQNVLCKLFGLFPDEW